METGSSQRLFDKASEETKVNAQTLVANFVDCSWLMTLSHPPLKLTFNVIDTLFTSSTASRFKQFSTQEDVYIDGKPRGTVLHVVWPAVELADGSGMYKKGEVITAA